MIDIREVTIKYHLKDTKNFQVDGKVGAIEFQLYEKIRLWQNYQFNWIKI